MRGFFLWILLAGLLTSGSLQAADCVVVLHGMARTAVGMAPVAGALEEAGFTVLNLDYPSRKEPIEALVGGIEKTVGGFASGCGGRVHFVTHSMGGLVARAYLNKHPLPNLGRVVMLAPPNQGSEVADFLTENSLTRVAYNGFSGPAGGQLVTRQDEALVKTLGPVTYPVGVIAGDRSVNLILSWLLLPGADDGKVAVSRTTVDGMADFIVMHTTHPFMMMNKDVQKQVVAFLKDGAFTRD